MNKYSCKFCWKRATEDERKEHCKIVINSNTEKQGECLIWVGYRDRDGYGRMKFDKKFVHSTRVLWFINYGEIPEDMVVCHKCDNPSCMNLDHLFLGTVRENTIDSFKKNRRKGRRGEKSNFHKLKEYDVLQIKKHLLNGVSQREIASKFGVSRGAICDIHRCRNWKHVQI